MADNIADTITGKLVEKALDGLLTIASLVKNEFDRIQSVESELGKLNDTRRRIDALLSDTEQRRYIEDDAVLLWLRNLKAIAFDAEDLDEEFKNTQNGNRRKRKRESFYMSTRRQLANRIDEIRSTYNTISQDRKNLRLMEGETIWRQPKRHHPYPSSSSSSSSPQESSLQGNGDVVYGRREEIRDIVGFLTSGELESGDLPVVSIFGGGGIGKTTLARHVFVDGAVNKYFDLKIWLGCSPGFDLLDAMKQIVESVEGAKCCLSSLDSMHYRVKGILTHKRFLLVLDNVWDEKFEFWEKLRAPLTYGAVGSKVLITTRSQKVLGNVQAARKVELHELPADDSWLLFRDRVFATADLKETPVLKQIGMEIVERCQGLPLAVKSIGGLLYSVTDEYEWKCLLKDMQHNGDVRNNVIPTLKVSYDHLPLHLKHCFSFCSVLPFGYEFDMDELVRLWMAVGLIKSNEKSLLEYLGGKYFTELLCRSFFKVSDNYQKGKQKYKMPSMIHDLASFVSKFETFREDSNAQEAGIARYGCLNNLEPATVAKVSENKGLRALILRDDNIVLTRQLLRDLIEKLRFLRAFDLSNSRVKELPASIENLILLRYLNLYNTQITEIPESVGNLCHLQTLDLGMCQDLIELPESIGYLKQLRYLSLYRTNIQRLPDSVSNLSNLQTLELGECYKLQELPNGIGNLSSLRHLGLHLDWNVWDRETDPLFTPPGIGRLTSLQTLSRFNAGQPGGSSLREVKNLNLRGKFCISKLEYVSKSDANEANLRDKNYIDSIMLHWSKHASNKEDVEEVIDCLRPHTDLKHLWIENYNGDRFPDWMMYSSFVKLETLRLSGCRKCQALPSLGNFPQLRSLHIESLHGVESLDDVFFTGSDDIEGFVSLETLSLIDMPYLPQLNIRGDRLSELTISGCTELREVTYLPHTIVKLKITNCPKLDWSTLPQLPVSLEFLEISSCSNFSSVEGLPVTLKEFRLSNCPSLKSLPLKMEELKSLHILEIDNVPGLKEIPELPCTLNYLTIRQCHTLQQRCQKDGADWQNIQFVPNRNIEAVSTNDALKQVRRNVSGTGTTSTLKFLCFRGFYMAV